MTTEEVVRTPSLRDASLSPAQHRTVARPRLLRRLDAAAAEAGGPSVYAFSADADRMLVGVARVVHTALMVGHDDDALGRIESVALIERELLG